MLYLLCTFEDNVKHVLKFLTDTDVITDYTQCYPTVAIIESDYDSGTEVYKYIVNNYDEIKCLIVPFDSKRVSGTLLKANIEWIEKKKSDNRIMEKEEIVKALINLVEDMAEKGRGLDIYDDLKEYLEKQAMPVDEKKEYELEHYYSEDYAKRTEKNEEVRKKLKEAWKMGFRAGYHEAWNNK